MSAPSSTAQVEKKPARKQGEGPNAELMRAVGATSYTPIPPDQHAWQKAEAEHNPPLHRLWSWLIHNTLTWGHTMVDGEPKGYATSKEGLELHLEHAAGDLKMDPGNARRAWREGEAIGLWRRGTPQEGKRRLYLCGKVAPPKVLPEEEVEKVCTDLFEPCLRKLPPYMRDQILSKPPEKVKEIVSWYARHSEVERLSLAEIVAAGRMVLGKMEDAKWREFDVEKRRLGDDGKAVEADEQQARQARLSSLLPQVEQFVVTIGAEVFAAPDPSKLADLEAQLRPKRSVQTRNDSVQRSKNAPYEDESNGVQTENRAPTLLPVPTSRKGQRAGGSGVSSSATPRDRDRSHDGEEHEFLHAPSTSVLSTATDQERRLAVELLTDLAVVQKQHRKRFGGDALDPENKGDLAWAVKVIRTTGTEELDAFVPFVEQKALKNALGVPVGVGLILDWAGDFRRAAGDRERQRAAEVEMANKREAFNRAADQNRAREQRIGDLVVQAFEQLPDAERKRRMDVAKQELKVDPHWAALSAEQKEDRAAVRVRAALRREIEAAEKSVGGAK